MKPPFQRNPVWQERQKAYLIDSIIRGYPVPELYLQTLVNNRGEEKHFVVDGQQRIRACLEFIAGEFALDDKSDYEGYRFDDLPELLQQQIFTYKFVVRTLPPLDYTEIREIFGRLNRNNVALNKQELRHATYWGEFISTMVDLAKHPFWVSSGLFTANDFRRMLDVEYVSEIAAASVFGPQNKKANLDSYYADFENEFPDKNQVTRTFSFVLDELDQLLEWPTKLRWSRKVDFYSLFLVLANRISELPFDRTERDSICGRLDEFSRSVDRILKATDEGVDKEPAAAKAYARGVRNSSDLSSRRLRIASLDAYLRGIDFTIPPTKQEQSDPLRSLPTADELLSRSPEDDEIEYDED
ncbi:DUF262 domain-containing protein [Saccharopolyspora sp. ID03-671]|uniref:DUF262 domain-containing protein n=1 Tax=Saccharopolyspora sp. ID03-671 TaxID=3073066 RepID=UPI0032496E7D